MIKIPVKTVERVATTTYVDVEVTKEIEFSGVANDYDPHFQELIDYLLTLNFVASSCLHPSFKDFPSYKQGGKNTCSLTSIKIVQVHYPRITISVQWKGIDSRGYVILDIPKQD